MPRRSCGGLSRLICENSWRVLYLSLSFHRGFGRDSLTIRRPRSVTLRSWPAQRVASLPRPPACQHENCWGFADVRKGWDRERREIKVSNACLPQTQEWREWHVCPPPDVYIVQLSSTAAVRAISRNRPPHIFSSLTWDSTDLTNNPRTDIRSRRQTIA